MPAYIVDFEDIGFTRDIDPGTLGLSEDEARAFTEKARAEGLLPEGILGLVEVTASADDSVHKDGRDADGDVKFFLTARLLVEADSADDAYEVEPPEALLRRVADAVAPAVGFEGNWEVNDVVDQDQSPTP